MEIVDHFGTDSFAIIANFEFQAIPPIQHVAVVLSPAQALSSCPMFFSFEIFILRCLLQYPSWPCLFVSTMIHDISMLVFEAAMMEVLAQEASSRMRFQAFSSDFYPETG